MAAAAFDAEAAVRQLADRVAALERDNARLRATAATTSQLPVINLHQHDRRTDDLSFSVEEMPVLDRLVCDLEEMRGRQAAAEQDVARLERARRAAEARLESLAADAARLSSREGAVETTAGSQAARLEALQKQLDDVRFMARACATQTQQHVHVRAGPAPVVDHGEDVERLVRRCQRMEAQVQGLQAVPRVTMADVETAVRRIDEESSRRVGAALATRLAQLEERERQAARFYHELHNVGGRLRVVEEQQVGHQVQADRLTSALDELGVDMAPGSRDAAGTLADRIRREVARLGEDANADERRTNLQRIETLQQALEALARKVDEVDDVHGNAAQQLRNRVRLCEESIEAVIATKAERDTVHALGSALQRQGEHCERALQDAEARVRAFCEGQTQAVLDRLDGVEQKADQRTQALRKQLQHLTQRMADGLHAPKTATQIICRQVPIGPGSAGGGLLGAAGCEGQVFTVPGSSGDGGSGAFQLPSARVARPRPFSAGSSAGRPGSPNRHRVPALPAAPNASSASASSPPCWPPDPREYQLYLRTHVLNQQKAQASASKGSSAFLSGLRRNAPPPVAAAPSTHNIGGPMHVAQHTQHRHGGGFVIGASGSGASGDDDAAEHRRGGRTRTAAAYAAARRRPQTARPARPSGGDEVDAVATAAACTATAAARPRSSSASSPQQSWDDDAAERRAEMLLAEMTVSGVGVGNKSNNTQTAAEDAEDEARPTATAARP